MADIFAVVADPTRRDLLRILLTRGAAANGSSGELSVSELVAELGLSQPTVSKHLRVLRDADLVSVREKGQHRFYRLRAAPLLAVEEWLRPFGTGSGTATGPDAPVSPDPDARVADPASGGAVEAAAATVGRWAADFRSRVGGLRRAPADTPR